MVPAAAYELDHLITLAVNTPQGLSLEDGLRRLCDVEAKGGGIWALRVEMQIDEQHQQLVVVDKAAAVEIDKMPLSSISNINSSGADKRAAYSNVLALNVLTDDGSNRLHLFMCCNDQASDVAANIRLVKQGQSVRSHSKPIGSQKKSGDSDNDKFIPVSNNFKQDEITQHNVTMFNHCLDDIEKFVALLQEAARKYSNSQYSQSSSFGYPIISATMNKELSLPSARDLVDILKKFKMAFNLLYKLQGVLRDPNAAELVHFLFSTLTLVVETSRDSPDGQLTLASNVVSPLFSRATLDFLNTTVTAKERDLLRSLGDAWNISRESWQGYVPPFFPSFQNGFQPPPSWLDDKSSTGTAVPLRVSQQPVKNTNSHASNGYERQDSGFRDETDNEPRNGSASFEQSLRQKGADVAEVTSTRMGSNDKELTVREGEILEILDSSRNWWHARNSVGLTGYVPYTALKRIPKF